MDYQSSRIRQQPYATVHGPSRIPGPADPGRDRRAEL